MGVLEKVFICERYKWDLNKFLDDMWKSENEIDVLVTEISGGNWRKYIKNILYMN